MFAKLRLPFVILSSALLFACGGSGSASSSGGSGGSTGGSGGSSTATGASGGTTSAGGTTSSGGATSSGGTGGTTTTPTCQGLGEPCTDCLAQSCEAQYCACYGDPACGALVQCTQGCAPGDAACNQNCLTNNSSAISEAALLNDCAAANCASCPGTAALDGCSKCLFTSCSGAMNACLANVECGAILTCAQGCDPADAFCQFSCYSDHPDGQSAADDVTSCLQNSCSGQCG